MEKLIRKLNDNCEFSLTRLGYGPWGSDDFKIRHGRIICKRLYCYYDCIENKHKLCDNCNDRLHPYHGTSDDLRREIDELRSEIEDLKNTITELKKD